MNNTALQEVETLRHKEALEAIHITLITVPKEITLDASITIQDKAMEQLVSGKISTIIDMSQTAYVNVNAWLVFKQVADKLKQYGGDFRIAAVSEDVAQTLRLIGLQDYFTIYATEEDAINSFKQGVPCLKN